MSDEQNTIQVESSADNLGEAPTRAPIASEKPTAVEPEAREGSDSEQDHGDDAGDEVGGEQQPGEPGKANTPRGVQKKLDKLTAARRTAEQERDYWRNEALKAKGEPVKEAKNEAPSDKGRPTREQFDYDEEAYLDAVADYRVEQKLRDKAVEEQKAREKQTVDEKMAAFMKKVEDFSETHADFREVALNSSLPVSKEMFEVILDSDHGHELMYYLGNNPEEAARIAQMKPHAAGVALARIEASLPSSDVQFTSETTDEQPPKKVTQAPPPIKTLNPSAPVKRELADMSMDDYVAERNRTRRKSNGFL